MSSRNSSIRYCSISGPPPKLSWRAAAYSRAWSCIISGETALWATSLAASLPPRQAGDAHQQSLGLLVSLGLPMMSIKYRVLVEPLRRPGGRVTVTTARARLSRLERPICTANAPARRAIVERDVVVGERALVERKRKRSWFWPVERDLLKAFELAATGGSPCSRSATSSCHDSFARARRCWSRRRHVERLRVRYRVRARAQI